MTYFLLRGEIWTVIMLTLLIADTVHKFRDMVFSTRIYPAPLHHAHFSSSFGASRCFLLLFTYFQCILGSRHAQFCCSRLRHAWKFSSIYPRLSHAWRNLWTAPNRNWTWKKRLLFGQKRPILEENAFNCRNYPPSVQWFQKYQCWTPFVHLRRIYIYIYILYIYIFTIYIPLLYIHLHTV